MKKFLIYKDKKLAKLLIVYIIAEFLSISYKNIMSYLGDVRLLIFTVILTLQMLFLLMIVLSDCVYKIKLTEFTVETGFFLKRNIFMTRLITPVILRILN